MGSLFYKSQPVAAGNGSVVLQVRRLGIDAKWRQDSKDTIAAFE